jgi:hypothetical protein
LESSTSFPSNITRAYCFDKFRVIKLEFSGFFPKVNPLNLAHDSKKRQHNKKIVRKRRDGDKMVLGQDLRIEQTIEYDRKTLIGKFHVRHISTQNFNY